MAGDFTSRTATAFRFMHDAGGRPPTPDKELHDELMASFWRLQARLVVLMEQGIAEGALRPQEPAPPAHALMGLSTHFFQGWVMQQSHGGEQMPLERFAAMVKEYFLHGAAVVGSEDKP